MNESRSDAWNRAYSMALRELAALIESRPSMEREEILKYIDDAASLIEAVLPENKITDDPSIKQ